MAEPKVKIDVQMSCNGLFSTMAHLLGIFRVEIFPALAGEEKASALLCGCIQVQEKRNTGQ